MSFRILFLGFYFIGKLNRSGVDANQTQIDTQTFNTTLENRVPIYLTKLQLL